MGTAGNSGEVGEFLVFLKCLNPARVVDRDTGNTLEVEWVGRPNNGKWPTFRADKNNPDVLRKGDTKYNIPGFAQRTRELFDLVSSSAKRSSIQLPAGTVDIMDTLGIKTMKASSKDKFDLLVKLVGETKALLVNVKSTMSANGSLANCSEQSVVTYRVTLKSGITWESAVHTGKPMAVCRQFKDMEPVGWKFNGLRNFSTDTLKMFFDVHGHYFMAGTPRRRTTSIIREIASAIALSGRRSWKRGQIEQAFVDVSRHFACNGTAASLVSGKVRKQPPAFLYLMKDGSLELRRIDGGDFEDYVLDHCRIDTADTKRYNQCFVLRRDGNDYFYDIPLLVKDGISSSIPRKGCQK